MKRLRIIGLSLLALFVLAAVAASTASAEEGFLPLAKKGVTVLGTKATLTDLAGGQIKCETVTGSGAFTTDKHGTGKLDFDECEVAGFPAFSLGETKPKTVKEALILASVNFLICLINSSALLFGIFVEVEPGSPVHVEVEALETLLVIEGGEIGHILTAAKTKTKLFVVDFTGKGGDAPIAECEGKKQSLTSNTNNAGKVMATEKVEKGLLQFTEEQELMDT